MMHLTRPAPEAVLVVLYEPITDELLNMYGAAVDSTFLLCMFQYVLKSGGKDSITLMD